MRIEGSTHVGRVRRRNEDAMGWDRQLGIALVADGIGGQPSGDIASRLAVDSALRAAATAGRGKSCWLAAGGDPARLVRLLNRAIIDRGKRDAACAGMGTTVVLAAADEERVVVAHVGDSRAYRFHEGILSRVTRDHNLAQEAVDHEWITPEQARDSLERHTLTRALGVDDDVEPDVVTFERSPGDLLLLCSDGLNGELHDREVEQLLVEHGRDLDTLAGLLVRTAVDRGGRDNVSVVLMQL